ncbi:hypothetical protein B0H11DRAFT_1918109 [Mycena galericulata]|nr:hypothetical protein B0H11DRAFT_1918109 [Mycena galericulata]
MLTGRTICCNVFAPSAVDSFPKTQAILLATVKVLRTNVVALQYHCILSQIQAAHLQKHPCDPSLDLANHSAKRVLEWLEREPTVRLVHGLANDGERLWGCVAKSEADVSRFGDDICINSDMSTALETSHKDYIQNVCRLLLCVTFAHETITGALRRPYPSYLPSSADIGNIDTIQRLALQTIPTTGGASEDKPPLEYTLREAEIKEYVDSLANGKILKLSNFELKLVEGSTPPLISTRGPSRKDKSAEPAHIGLVIIRKPGEASTWAAADRAPYTSVQFSVGISCLTAGPMSRINPYLTGGNFEKFAVPVFVRQTAPNT